MSKYEGHTPGTWSVSLDEDVADDVRGHIGIHSQTGDVAEALGYDYETPEVKINARLIADAPRLLRRIKRLHGWLRELGMHKMLWRQNFNQSGEWVQRCIDRDLENGKLRAAIADAPALAHRIERALNRLRYMQSGSMAIAPSTADIGRLIRTLEGEE